VQVDAVRVYLMFYRFGLAHIGHICRRQSRAW
jgi:hypothetical protein